VVGKYAPDAIIGALGASKAPKAKKVKGAKKGGAPAVQKDKGDFKANHHAWGEDRGHNWRIEAYDDYQGVLLIPFMAYIRAGWHLLFAILYEVCATIFTAKNIKISGDRVGLTRSAIFLIMFIVIHAVGNLHVFGGPDDFNGYGYFYVRLYWTGFGLPANIVEEYVLLSALLHVFVAMKRTWDSKLAMGLKSGQLNLAISGLMLLTFMTVHLFQFRFGDTTVFGPYYIRPPPYLINLWGILNLNNFNLFWTDADCDKGIERVGVRDIYKLEFQILGNIYWAAFYIFSVCLFMIHASLGWQKVVTAPAFGIPKGHHDRVKIIGYIIFVAIGAIYISFPAFVQLTEPLAGEELDIQDNIIPA